MQTSRFIFSYITLGKPSPSFLRARSRASFLNKSASFKESSPKTTRSIEIHLKQCILNFSGYITSTAAQMLAYEKKNFGQLACKTSRKSPFGVIFCFNQKNSNFSCNCSGVFYDNPLEKKFESTSLSLKKMFLKWNIWLKEEEEFWHWWASKILHVWTYGDTHIKRKKLRRKTVMSLILPEGQLFFFWNRSFTATFRGLSKVKLISFNQRT